MKIIGGKKKRDNERNFKGGKEREGRRKHSVIEREKEERGRQENDREGGENQEGMRRMCGKERERKK